MNAITTFTPVISSSGSGYFSYTAATRSGTYLKLGRQVAFFINIDWVGTDAGVGSVVVTGLLPALAIGSAPITINAYGVTVGSNELYGLVNTSGTLTLYLGGATASDSPLLGSALNSTGGIKASGMYLSLT